MVRHPSVPSQTSVGNLGYCLSEWWACISLGGVRVSAGLKMMEAPAWA